MHYVQIQNAHLKNKGSALSVHYFLQFKRSYSKTLANKYFQGWEWTLKVKNECNQHILWTSIVLIYFIPLCHRAPLLSKALKNTSVSPPVGVGDLFLPNSELTCCSLLGLNPTHTVLLPQIQMCVKLLLKIDPNNCITYRIFFYYWAFSENNTIYFWPLLKDVFSSNQRGRVPLSVAKKNSDTG